jgi:hypothetical protein
MFMYDHHPWFAKYAGDTEPRAINTFGKKFLFGVSIFSVSLTGSPQDRMGLMHPDHPLDCYHASGTVLCRRGDQEGVLARNLQASVLVLDGSRVEAASGRLQSTMCS